MKSAPIFIIFLALIGCGGLSSCSRKPASTLAAESSREPSREFSIKENGLRNIAVISPDTLTLERRITKGEGGKFIYPSFLSSSRNGDVFIADNNGHNIQYVPSGSSSSEPFVTSTPLHFPMVIRQTSEQIVVSDDDGLKLFDKKGTLQKLLRTYYGIFNFAVANDSIYANVSYRSPKDNQPLITKLNYEGERVGGFGSRSNNPDLKGLDDQSYLVSTGELLFVAFRHRPLVQVYNLSQRKLVNEFEVKHEIFESLKPLAADKSFTNPSPARTALPRYIAGIACVENALFVLLHLPQVEIVEFDFAGHEKNRFRSSKVTRVLDYFGFDVRKQNGEYNFDVGVAGIVDHNDIPFLLEFIATPKD
jgi:hypothetical protein